MRLFYPLVRTMAIVVCAISACLSSAHAGVDVSSDIAWLPADVDVAVVARDLSQLRAMPMGEGAAELFSAVVMLGGATQGETLTAWRALSNQLGFKSERDAFDALLGERFVYASRERVDGASDWIVFSRITPKIDRLVRQRLDVSPREIKNERVLMSLEGGKYRLASSLDKRDGRSWLMLAPVSRDGLFNEIVNLDRAAPRATLAGSPAIETMRTLGPGGLAAYFQLDKEGTGGWIAAVGEARGRSIRVRLKADSGAPTPAIEPWSTAKFDELRDGALYAHIERLPTRDEAQALDAEKGEVSIWTGLRNIFELPRRALGAELDLILGNRLAIVMLPREGGGVSLGVGLEASDVRALATPGDAAMRPIVDTLRGVYGAEEASFEFVGTLPRALRRITLRSPIRDKPLPPFGTELSVTWSFREAPGVAPAGWWIVGSDMAAFDRAAAALSEQGAPEDEGERGMWLSVLEAHPRAMLEALREGGVAPPPAARGLSMVESVWLRLRASEEEAAGNVIGEGAVRFNERRELRRLP